jgi:putative flippase GtrA
MKQKVLQIFLRVWAERVKFIKYVIVGTASVAIDVSLLIVCADLLKLNPTVSVVITQILVMGFNFTLNKKWSFGSTGATRAELVRYCILATWNYTFSVGAMYIGNELWEMHHLAVRIASIMCMVLWNFALFRWWVYRKKIA